MSINHFSTDHPEALWWAQHHHQQQQQQQPLMEPTPNSSPPSKPPKPNSSFPSHLYHRHCLNNSFTPPHPPHPMFSSTQNPTLGFNLNYEDDEEHDPELDDDNKPLTPQPRPQDQVHMQKEPMFEKPLTPSDVGKLNRLVIPKQHAEKYFPPVGDSVDNKGLTLSFEDELAKCWRFRYSYWNSSQSYVLTKGWSRYVKEKQLDAGDVVFFERHLIDGERLFIGWRRRGDNTNSSGTGGGVMVQGYGGGTWSRGLFSSSEHQPYQHAHGANLTASVQYQHECLHAGSAGGQNLTLPIANSKRLRLFGVNLECQLDDSEPWTSDGSSTSSQDITLSRDFNQMRNRRG